MKAEAINTFIQLKSIAVVGVSRSKSGFGLSVYEHLKKNGYTAYAINRKGGFCGNTKLFTSLFDIGNPIDGIVTVVPPSETESTVHTAFDLGIKNVWMQLGSDSQSAIDFCLKNNMNVVYKECIMMFVEPVNSIHKFHRFINKITGKYPKMETPH
jgi:uncharacterized protein